MIEIIKTEWGLEAVEGRSSARHEGKSVVFANMGCSTLSSMKDLSKSVKQQWDARYGKSWKDRDKKTVMLAETLLKALEFSGLSGLDLWDTMRTGSSYWRPGANLRHAAEQITETENNYGVSYFREDALCPPLTLIEGFRSDAMSFGSFARAYADYLEGSKALLTAAAAVIRALARDRLAVFYCTDPYIPGYSDKRQMFSSLPYQSRDWLKPVEGGWGRMEGCHRFILSEELCRFFKSMEASAKVLEVDQTFDRIHVREAAF